MDEGRSHAQRPRSGATAMKKYEWLANEIAESIRHGALRRGDRLPSVRVASRARELSPSTVFQAYYLLEARGLVESRPRSGYVVMAPPAWQAEPATSAPRELAQEVAVADLVFEVLGHVRRTDIVPLGSAFPSPALFPLPALGRALAKAVRKLNPQRTVEDLPPGSDELRRQIALRYFAMGVELAPDEIVITNGAMEALNLCLESVTRPGDLVALEVPTFYAALQAIERLDLRAVEVATHPRTGVDLPSLEAVLDRHPVKACWFMPNFQNPLGCLMPDASKQALVELLAARGVPLIEDDVYGELHLGSRRPPPAKAYDRDGLVMHCGSFSKSLAPGYRVGWVAAGRYSEQVTRRKLMSSLAAAVPSQEGLSEFLRHGAYDRHLRQLREALAARQALAIRVMSASFPAGTRISQPDGGYCLWTELPPEIDALKLHRLALAQKVSLAPGHLFSADRRFTHHLRVNYGHASLPQLESALRLVGKLASQSVKRSER